jgi:hypothetical protein
MEVNRIRRQSRQTLDVNHHPKGAAARDVVLVRVEVQVS